MSKALVGVAAITLIVVAFGPTHVLIGMAIVIVVAILLATLVLNVLSRLGKLYTRHWPLPFYWRGAPADYVPCPKPPRGCGGRCVVMVTDGVMVPLPAHLGTTGAPNRKFRPPVANVQKCPFCQGLGRVPRTKATQDGQETQL